MEFHKILALILNKLKLQKSNNFKITKHNVESYKHKFKSYKLKELNSDTD